ncbi:MAG: hypothetical protein ACPGUV_09390 [Polyangiales bacterium]
MLPPATSKCFDINALAALQQAVSRAWWSLAERQAPAEDWHAATQARLAPLSGQLAQAMATAGATSDATLAAQAQGTASDATCGIAARLATLLCARLLTRHPAQAPSAAMDGLRDQARDQLEAIEGALRRQTTPFFDALNALQPAEPATDTSLARQRVSIDRDGWQEAGRWLRACGLGEVLDQHIKVSSGRSPAGIEALAWHKTRAGQLWLWREGEHARTLVALHHSLYWSALAAAVLRQSQALALVPLGAAAHTAARVVAELFAQLPLNRVYWCRVHGQSARAAEQSVRHAASAHRARLGVLPQPPGASARSPLDVLLQRQSCAQATALHLWLRDQHDIDWFMNPRVRPLFADGLASDAALDADHWLAEVGILCWEQAPEKATQTWQKRCESVFCALGGLQ